MKCNEPLVSICCTTYNHVKYISDAIEGILMQNVSFPIELLIHDDASTDGTTDVLKKYIKNHSDLIIPIFQNENQYSKGMKPWPYFVFPRARGKYIALCEGDDYWTDPSKLQKQVDFLENNKSYNVIYHKVKSIENNITKNYIWNNRDDYSFTFQNSIVSKNGATLSMVFRNNIDLKQFRELITDLSIADWPLECLLTLSGKGFYMDVDMGVYRIHKAGRTQELFYRRYIRDRYLFLLRFMKMCKIDEKNNNILISVLRRICVLCLLTPNVALKRRTILLTLFSLKKIYLFDKIKYNDLMSIKIALRRFTKYYLIKFFSLLKLKAKND